MSDTFKLLNEYSGALTVIFTAVVTLSTVVYAILTAFLVLETRRLRQVQTEPKIQITIVDLDFAINIVRLSIKNIGQGAARNLRLSPSVVSGSESAEHLLEQFISPNFFHTGLGYLGPGGMVYSGYTSLSDDFEGKSKSILKFKIEYENLTGSKYRDELLLDMSEIRGRYQLGKPNLYAIAKSLEKIQSDIHHLATGFKRLKIEAYDRKDREAERTEREAWLEEAGKKLGNP